MELALDREIPLRKRTLFALLFIELLILVGALALPHQKVLLLAIALGGGFFVLFLPVYPQILFPLMIAATALDVSGIIGPRRAEARQFAYSSLFTPTLFHIVGGAALVFCVAYLLFKKRASLPRLELTIPLILFLSIYGISVLYSPNKLEGVVYFLRFLALSALIYVTVFLIGSRKGITLVVASVIIFAIATAGLGIFQTLTEGYFLPATFVSAVGANIPRAAGTFHNPNDYATFLMVAIVLSVALFINLRLSWWMRLALLATTAVLLSGLVTSFSRANWLAAAVGIFCAALLSRKLKFLFVVLLVLLAIVIAITAISPNFADLVFGRFTSIFKTFTEFESFTRVSSTARVQFAMGAFSMFLDHPFLGIGARGFPVLFDKYKPIDFPIWLPTRESHTLPATIIAELGIIGFAIALWLVVAVLKAGIRGIRDINDEYLKTVEIGFVCVFIGYQVSMLFTGAITDNFFWIMTGMLFAVRGVDLRARGSREGK